MRTFISIINFKNAILQGQQPQPNISLKLVLESVNNILQFISNSPKELLFDLKTLSILRILRSKISHYQIDTLRQSQIDKFITITS